MELKFEAQFQGGLADEHKLPAYLGTESLNGIARSLLIVTNYVAEGRVRYKDYKFDNYDVNIVAIQPGSFEAVYEIVVNNPLLSIGGSIGLGVTGNLLTDLIKTVFRRCIGKSGARSIEDLENNRALKSGDIEAIVDAIEPAIKRAHNVIGDGAHHVAIINGDNNVVKFDGASKRYVNSSILAPGYETKLFSVDNYSVNSRYGRAFDFEVGKTVPYIVNRAADRKTIQTILDSHESYALRRLGDELSSAVAFRYRQIVSADGRVKKLVVFKARPDIADL